MTGGQQPAVTIEHEIPGRLRLRLSHALLEPERMRRLVEEHAGVGEVRYTAISRSVLVRYEPNHISPEEIVIRIATGLSLEHDNAGIRVLRRPPTREMTDSAFYSGVVLIAAFALRIMGQNQAANYRSGSDRRPHHGRGGSAPRLGGISLARKLRPRGAQRNLSTDRNAAAAMHCQRRSSPGSAPSAGIWSDCQVPESRFVPPRPDAPALRRASRLWSRPNVHRRTR